MNRNRTTSRRLLTLLGELCNGTLGDREGPELERLLADDPLARLQYTNYLSMHATLHGEASTLFTPTADESQSLPPAAGGLRDSARLRRKWLVYALAAGLTGVALMVGANNSLRAPWGDGSAAGQSHTVARITGTRNCLWTDSEIEIGYGAHLHAGQRLHLREGLAEITFNDGATLLLEGPASFVVDASDTLALVTGRVTAVVPKRAQGFRIHTRVLDVFDVGAELGLYARESGATEVHVFNGLAEADVLDADGLPRRRLRLNAAEAARINPVSTTIEEFPADEAEFIRSMAPTTGPHDGLLAYEGFAYPDGPLSAQNGGFGWAGPWFSIAADEAIGPDSNRVAKGSLAAEGFVPLGNRAALVAQQNRIRRSLATSVGGVFDAAGLVENQDGVRLVGRDGNQVYLSFLQRVSATDDGFYGLELHRGDGNPNRALCIGNGANGAGYAATSNVNVYGAENGPKLGSESLETVFFVVKITFGVDNRDTVEIFRNPRSLRDEQVCKVDAMLRGNFAFDRISIANFDGTKVHEVDEVRVGTHFLAVTGRWGAGRGQLLEQITFRQSRPDNWLLAARIAY